jgi:hypothetical protein
MNVFIHPHKWDEKDMSTVIAFPKLYRKPKSFFGQAQILIFTGVRHERLTDEDIMHHKPKRRLVTRQSELMAEELVS